LVGKNKTRPQIRLRGKQKTTQRGYKTKKRTANTRRRRKWKKKLDDWIGLNFFEREKGGEILIQLV